MEKLQDIQLSFKCPKAFNDLIPCAGGWYCNGCHKVVHDMRGKSEHEIKSILADNACKMCGMFEADRIRITTPLSKWRKWAAAAVLTLGFAGLHQTLMAQQSQKTTLASPAKGSANQDAFPGGTYGVVVEASAEYPGGIEKFQQYVASRVRPNASCKPGQKGIFTFVIEKDGSLTDVKAIRSPFDSAMNASIITIIGQSKKWRPGMQAGKLLRQQFTIPVIPVP